MPEQVQCMNALNCNHRTQRICCQLPGGSHQTISPGVLCPISQLGQGPTPGDASMGGTHGLTKFAIFVLLLVPFLSVCLSVQSYFEATRLVLGLRQCLHPVEHPIVPWWSTSSAHSFSVVVCSISWIFCWLIGTEMQLDFFYFSLCDRTLPHGFLKWSSTLRLQKVCFLEIGIKTQLVCGQCVFNSNP